ncbi:hypothetical protein IKE98_02650 [Candidatus Saccharibacteria bacterium]|nr:hypothetical protein [Candidatus Saccharibacteria bacterium]
MKTYYTSSKYANYTHIHMYVFEKYFIEQIKESKLDYEESYSINVEIDGNVAIWKMSINDPQIEYIFNELVKNPNFIDKRMVKKATKDIAKKMGKKFEITDPELLLEEIRSIKLSDKKPIIKDNDSLDSPAVRFY